MNGWQVIRGLGSAAGGAARRLALGFLWVYRTCISPLKPPCCRFSPTCSAYAREAILRFGLFRGSWLALWRLARCHPFYRGPLHDPVPPARTSPETKAKDVK